MKNLLYIGILVFTLLPSCDTGVEEWTPIAPQTPPPSQESIDYQSRSYEIFELVQEYYKVGNLYRENFPVQSGDNTYSFLWPYNCLTTGAAFLTDLGYDVGYKELIDGLSCYWMENNGVYQVGGYGSGTDGTKGTPDRFYDDNSIVGLSLLEAYERLGDESYLVYADRIVDFLELGVDDIFDGGLWWNESLKNVSGNESSNKPACANGYAILFLLKYYQVCPQEDKESILAFAKRLYNWVKNNLKDNSDNCYWNSKDASGTINKTKWTYNVGVMIQNGVCLYKITGDETYLNEAKASAQGAYTTFVRSLDGVGLAYPDHDPWFNTKLLRGYVDIAPYDSKVRTYIDVYADYINYAYEHARTPEGFFYEDWSGKEPKRASQLLMQDAVIESYAILALYYKNNQ